MSREYDEDIRKAAEAIGMGFNDSAIKAAFDLGLLDEVLDCMYDAERNDDDRYITDEELAKLEEEMNMEALTVDIYYY